ncbi:MAG: 50S ribosomal protein L4 [Rhodospirillaceae bacterium]|nr:50S ribosomal protein L4 [Rhodospirillaceae bacterium]
MKCPVVNLENKSAGDIELDDSVFGLPARADLLHRAVNWQLAKRRSGNHKTKERAEIRGSTAKPFNQKGTGRARQGDKKAPHMRGGGVAFGPKVRSHAHGLTKKVRRLALKTALSSKHAAGKLVVLESAVSQDGKTSALSKQFKGLGWESALVIAGRVVDENFARAISNIREVDVLPQTGANVYDILRRDMLVLTRDAVEQLQERLK